MARKILIRSSQFPYHVYNRTNDRGFYSLPLSEVYSIYVDQLRLLTWAFGAQIHAFVLMSNHYHLLISTPDQNLDDMMEFFQSTISRIIKQKCQSERFCFTSRYKWSLIKNASHFKNVYRYIYQNPVRAKICDSVDDYKFSSISGKLGRQALGIPLFPHSCFSAIIPEIGEELDWLNLLMGQEEQELTSRALRRREFKYPARLEKKSITVKKR